MSSHAPQKVSKFLWDYLNKHILSRTCLSNTTECFLYCLINKMKHIIHHSIEKRRRTLACFVLNQNIIQTPWNIWIPDEPSHLCLTYYLKCGLSVKMKQPNKVFLWCMYFAFHVPGNTGNWEKDYWLEGKDGSYSKYSESSYEVKFTLLPNRPNNLA